MYTKGRHSFTTSNDRIKLEVSREGPLIVKLIIILLTGGKFVCPCMRKQNESRNLRGIHVARVYKRAKEI